MLKKLDNAIHALNRYDVNRRRRIIIFNIYIAQINIQEDMIKCALHIKIESKITMLPIYNFEFTIKCESIYYRKHLKETIN